MLRKYKYLFLVGILCFVFLVPGIIFLRNAMHFRERTHCRENLETLGAKLTWNADKLTGDSKGTYPPMSPDANRLMFTTEGLLPRYVPEPELLVCPSQVSKGIPQEFDDGSYFYTGYVLAERGFILPSGWPPMLGMDYQEIYYPFDNLMAEYSDIYSKQISNAADFEERYVREGQVDIYRLTDGVSHVHEKTIDCVGDDIQEDVKIHRYHVPVLIEWPDNHSSERLGGHVLWLDRRVEWRKYPGEFPMTEEAMAIFTKLAGRPPIGRRE